ncbi:glycosyltransferase [Paucilactobacillus vaccinostercus DSM 20634]|uniref:Glycosyltransferase n=1 Tax=Paucilactobacillus vaccinostercus DSM 20634 TaxID=1423813 RepID=A0A0R2A4F1_9LACO|nr:DUF4422 domain-containing protein [Paucilactobacillus vaccinostercus]KRM61381.1 glycosyltransferase [Paucilactobacillus vaccinostercus DSM 20634]
MNTKVMVAVHKNYVMPKNRSLYLPVFVGKEIHPKVNEDFQGDNTGDNISAKNSSYNELTALYWGWKNLDVDALGLVHYRRYLSLHHKKSLSSILSTVEIEKLLKNSDVILPKKRHYYIETNYSHYIHAHPKEELDLAKKIISQKYPEYIDDYESVMQQTSAHMFNMFVMKKELLDRYCEWLFDILAEIEKNLDTTDYDKYQSRVYGFISERLLDVWLQHNDVQYREVNVIYLESQHWPSKIFNFLKRKISR